LAPRYRGKKTHTGGGEDKKRPGPKMGKRHENPALAAGRGGEKKKLAKKNGKPFYDFPSQHWPSAERTFGYLFAFVTKRKKGRPEGEAPEPLRQDGSAFGGGGRKNKGESD